MIVVSQHCILMLIKLLIDKPRPIPQAMQHDQILLTPVNMQNLNSHPIMSLQTHLFYLHDHFISPLGCRVRRFEFNCGAVPEGVGVPLDDFNGSFPRALARTDEGSGRKEGAAIDDWAVRSIDVLGSRLLLNDVPFAISELVRRTEI